MSVLKYFKNTPRSSSQRATGPKCNFFFLQIRNEVSRKKSPIAPPRATAGPSPRARQGGLSPPPGRQGGPVAPPSGDRWARPMGAAGGPVAPPLSPPPGDRGMPPYISSNPPLPSSFEPENSTKNPEKKRGVRRRKAAKPCRIQHL